MNRELTKREKILLLIFAIMIILLGYYKIILEPIDDQISNYEGMQLQEETEVDTKTTQAVKMSVMEKEIEKAKASGIKRDVPDYDNSAVLLPKLYEIMDSATDYSMTFQDVVTEGNVVSRGIDITFQTRSYTQARKIIDKIYDMGYALEISDITMQSTSSTGNTSSMSTYINVTFYEAIRD